MARKKDPWGKTVLVDFDDGSFKSYKFELQFQNFI